ncbi:MAG: anti-sigma factor family protein [Candidatus Methylomirabilia bacterium]
MTCEELRSRLEAHLDGELDVAHSLEADEHLTFCMSCQWAYARERELRQVLKTRLPRVTAPAELHARVRTAIRAADRRDRWGSVPRLVRWGLLPAVAAALVLMVLTVSLREPVVSPPPLAVAGLVGKHQMYSRLDAPAEIASASYETVGGWLRQRVRFEVPVPDFTSAGIRLVGARLSDLGDREVAYLLYEKEGTLVSLFGFPKRGLALPVEGWVELGDSRFYAKRVEGVEVVLWTQGDLAYALVSPLSRETLFQCALTVWRLAGSEAVPGPRPASRVY